MYYTTIFSGKSGFTNQIFALITSIIIAYKNNERVIVVDHLLNNISKEYYTPISQIFNIEKINIFLKKYNIIIVDKYNVNFELLSVKYGIDTCNIDLTKIIKNNFYKNDILKLNKNIVFNHLGGDPYYGVKKHIYLNYTINDYVIQEVYNESLTNNICIDILHSTYIFNLGWINTINITMFEDILTHIYYNDDFIEKSKNILQGINSNSKINVLHLRLETDAIRHWSKINNMSECDFTNFLEIKYILLIAKYFTITDEIIIVSDSLSNRVIDFLIDNNYTFKYSQKFFEDREKNAIVDLLVSKNCNNMFIGNFNIVNMNGSTFSYYIGKLIEPCVKHIYIDLDNILHDECIAN